MSRLSTALLLGLAVGPLWAQPPTPAPPASAQPAPPAAPAQAAPQVSLEAAYKKEFAFLQAQKRELTVRLAEVKTAFAADHARLEGEVRRLEASALAAKSEAEALSAELTLGEQRAQALADHRELLAVTFDQARATLGGFGEDALEGEAFAAAGDADKLGRTFGTALATLGRLSALRSEAGRFYLGDGSEVDGTIVRFGNIAAFGVSKQGSGALAPAGGGRFRLWAAPAAESAQTLAAGRLPATVQAYLYENPNAAVADPEAKTVWNEIRKGGIIGYITLALGALALGLVVLRALFLKNAGAAIAPIIEAAARPLGQGRIEDAIAAAKRFRGSAARVVTAALRNIERDREHLEDIVSESILHESSHLNRFGGFILMIAAVAPLLGLLGTVTGMIQTFDVITEFGTSDSKLLSGGIATALVTTEEGLMVAIPLLLLGNLLNGWAERIKDDMEKAALKVVNLYQDARLAAARRAA